ncbi:MAG: hypothetical protein KDB03_23755 [Planctomycetales bacterium]|nr:hypothetical protein [Planctomycetales bacterium]
MVAIRIMLVAVCLLPLMGCNPRAIIRQNPSQHDRGLRFYRPKPYLLVSPTDGVTEVTVKGDQKTTKVGKSDSYVSMQLEYLPDFSEEYSISVRPGLGQNNTKITLKDGWNLTQLDQDLDSNFDDNVKAIAELAKVAGTIVGTGGGVAADSADGATKSFVVPATNVPLGYYESIIGRDACGKKQLYGWRYVGFAPYLGCPSGGTGSMCIDCGTDLYGLVFRNGVMTFAPLYETQIGDVELKEQQTSITRQGQQSLSELEKKVLSAVRLSFPNVAVKAITETNWTVTSNTTLSSTQKAQLTALIENALQTAGTQFEPGTVMVTYTEPNSSQAFVPMQFHHIGG